MRAYEKELGTVEGSMEDTVPSLETMMKDLEDETAAK